MTRRMLRKEKEKMISLHHASRKLINASVQPVQMSLGSVVYTERQSGGRLN